MTQPDGPWIAVDWGTSRLRAWAMDGGRAVENRSSDQGMGGLAPEAFEPALLSLIIDWLPEGHRIQVKGRGMSGRVVTLGQQLLKDGSVITIPDLQGEATASDKKVNSR